MSTVANWEMKAAFGHRLWEATPQWGLRRNRIKEPRGHEHLIERHREGPLNDLFAELIESRDNAELTVGLYDNLLRF